MSNIKILVASHKYVSMPEDRNVYLPVLVGAGSNYKKGIDFQRDDDGENISYKNPNYNELTAIYWAWKNLKDTDVVGLVHYRRLFSIDKNDIPICRKDIEELLLDNDVILPKKRKYYIETNRSHYIHAHNELPLDELRKIIKNEYSEYLQYFDNVMNRRSAHMFNMFIMKKKYFESYSKFIFNVLSKLEHRIDISNYSIQESRVYGYLSELLMDVWLEKNKIKYKEINWYQTGDKHILKKIFFFLCRKFGVGYTHTHF
ncbi:DUF4422 domain-containing protein [Companilactobacillus nuruki]|uniref:DUF4422 domain-containing protein n=1 Tax=Companilactobacillus nuruki TaxID=1993540 RepID=A0A2N7AT14_9LACO|nr:DUF4422 domain-containing protein [Companilactobacillus nuruki]PMD68824.1 hypothetical protein CBP76_08980 [Companilactobacillus nuruki]